MSWKLLSSALFTASVAIATTFVAGGSGPAQALTRIQAPTSPPTWAEGGRRERLTPDNCVFAFIDHQTGLMNLVDNVEAVAFKNLAARDPQLKFGVTLFPEAEALLRLKPVSNRVSR